MPSEHPKYGDASYLVFLVEDIIFQVPRRRLKQSRYFQDMLEDAHTGAGSEGKDNEHPISLGGISAFEMTSFLDVLETSVLYDDPGPTFSQWAAALHLATMWDFDDIRERIIVQMDKNISEVEPMDRVDASLKCRVEKWLHPAYEVLCTRDAGPSDAEAERLGVLRLNGIWRIREALKSTASTPTQSSCNCNSCRNGRPSCSDLLKKEEALKFP
ncbi:hypothetical protein M407DRAFT_17599 [Tulasnella calospora MUT 4182]|uniref:BTB domain-containing protein n=1 Tax=Tulasnella calospora MUT 4182 TaxID=1051891 RepID=A0A0C3LI19_9AGAM|nr:hypothetical protein M407DRAFT_17599 [Tulasnella calospora MUT 4182]